MDTYPSDRTLLAKRPMPTPLSSAGIKTDWNEQIKQQALFSARTTSNAYLDMVRKNLAAIASGKITPQGAEKNLRQTLQNLGYRPETGFPDGKTGKVPPARPASIQDLSSSQRIRLIIDTNVKQARSLGQIAASENPVVLMTIPAWELTRTGARKKPRGDWKRRWQAAGNSIGWNGALKNRFIALKTSPIWQALGNGVGGFNDTIGTAFPPFAFGSGMAWIGVDWDDWESMCKAEGVPDHLDEITARAKGLKQGTISPAVKQSPSAPRDDSAGLVGGIGKTSSYQPDFSHRQNAERAVDKALDAARKAIPEIQKMAKMVLDEETSCRKHIESNPDISDDALPHVRHCADYSKHIASYIQDIVSLYGKVSNYGSSIQNTPKPTNYAQQRVYNDLMDKMVSLSGKAEKSVYSAFKAAKMRVDAAVRIGKAVKSLD